MIKNCSRATRPEVIPGPTSRYRAVTPPTREKGGFYPERRVGFTKKTAMRHRRVGGRAVTVTAMLPSPFDDESAGVIVGEVVLRRARGDMSA